MKLKSILTLVLTAFFVAIGSQAQASSLYTINMPSANEKVEDIAIIKRNIPTTSANHNERLLVLLSVQGSGSGSGSSLTRIRMYDAGTGLPLNEMDMPCVGCKGYKLENLGAVNSDRVDDLLVRTRSVDTSAPARTGNIIIDTKNIPSLSAILGVSETLQYDLAPLDAIENERPRVVSGDVDKDGDFDYIHVTRKSQPGLPDKIEGYSIP